MTSAGSDAGTSSGRPGVLRWLYYAFGGSLPRHAQWVLRDLTCRTWLLRHAARSLVQCCPALLLLLLPGRTSVVVLLPVLVIVSALYLALSFAQGSRNRRLYQHGFLPELVLPRDHR